MFRRSFGTVAPRMPELPHRSSHGVEMLDAYRNGFTVKTTRYSGREIGILIFYSNANKHFCLDF